jgi:hypothetical protein
MSLFLAPQSLIVPVRSSDGRILEAVLESAVESDMPQNWQCNWPVIWQNSDFACQLIVKLSVDRTLWGLIRYGLYPYPFLTDKAAFLNIENLEAHPSRRPDDIVYSRSQPSPPTAFTVTPVGQWLIWHACDMALHFCTNDQPLITLVALSGAVDYYRDVIGMNFAGVASAAPGEDGYAFTFGKSEAKAFRDRIQTQYGQARRIDRE